MISSQEINKAIGAHGMWKQRLADAIKNGRSDTPPDRVEPDNLCDFGKWLYSLSPADQNCEHYKKVKALHASFHKEAAKVLRLALGGHIPEAEKGIGMGGSFSNISSDLTLAMMNWKKTVGA